MGTGMVFYQKVLRYLFDEYSRLGALIGYMPKSYSASSIHLCSRLARNYDSLLMWVFQHETG
ncbi:hypothetical protein P886_3967 [Alteromonadaceae bacterium 2753L.S.0a.02]|nr:hypothetical protein P886_3967 [Alteromonadaceae bacterium 2753L.S.0a.02]